MTLRDVCGSNCGFVNEQTLAEVAAVWPTCRIIVRCHSYRFIVTADQAAAAIAQQGDQLRDASVLPDDLAKLRRVAL